jgi:DNA mismatch repair protein MutS
MMRQYLETKALHPDAILFFRLGDFYEMFYEDAVRASELLQIALTARSKGDERVPMCGVPYHAARRYIGKLVEHGLRVAICDQVEAPGTGPGIVRREVTRVITPGMVLDEESLEAGENNFLAAVHFGDRGFGAALLDASTGEFLAFEAESAAELADVLGRADPKELLVCEEELAGPAVQKLRAAMARPVALASLDRAAFDPPRAAAFLRAHFQVASLEGFGLSRAADATAAAGAALRYLKATQKTQAAHVDRLSLLRPDGYLVLDEASRANLEILRNLRDGGRAGSLLGVLDRTFTAPGARKLSRWLVAPLRSPAEINARLDAVEELVGRAIWRDELALHLRQVADLERLCARLSLAAGSARDLRGLANSLAALPKIAEVLSRCGSPLLSVLVGPLGSLKELAQVLNSAVVDEPPASLKEGGFIRPGYNGELDELVALSTSGKDFLLQIESRERERTGIGSLKVRYNRVFGYYLEVTRSNLHLVPPDYVRKQTTVGAERYVTSELSEYEEKVLAAEEKRCALEQQLFEELCARVLSHASLIRAAAEAISTCDALLSFARCAVEYGYRRPEVDESGAIAIAAGRHPVVERVLTSELFVPNDLHLDPSEARILIITGPNMAGKSTVMRQTALIALMAQAGSFVPAQSARIGLCDRIFTRVGAADNLARGQSTFMVEMTETANILHHATRRSLVLLDEIGRGTSTFDGLSIAWAVAEQLHDRVGARTLFATHYHELTDLAREKPRVKNFSVAVKETGGKVTFLRKLIPGGANRSYGIEVARLAGLPPEVLARAREILANLESGELDEAGRPRVSHPARPSAVEQLAFFAREVAPALSTAQQEVCAELRAASVDALTPLEALNLLAKWKKALDGEGKGSG